MILLDWKTKKMIYVDRKSFQGTSFLNALPKGYDFHSIIGTIVLRDMYNPECTDPWSYHYFHHAPPPPAEQQSVLDHKISPPPPSAS